MKKVFIDGSSGTTGLRIRERLKERKDIRLITLSDELRKDVNARKDALNSADIVFLCLPDSASIEAVSMVDNPKTCIIDTSTAHRTNKDWVYGFAEIDDRRKKIKRAKRIANPGCHASGFISLIAPLVKNKLLKKSVNLSCFSLTGYSGGGKKMIAEYEESEKGNVLYSAPRIYALGQAHKHLPEMKVVCKLDNAPVFMPVVSNYYSGMQVIVPLNLDELKIKKSDIIDVYRSYYTTDIVKFVDNIDDNGLISSVKMSGRDDMLIGVEGNDSRVTLISLFDNLGKGASGAAIQNMNIVLSCDEKTGLNIG